MACWIVLSNEDGGILAVYGSALEDMAESKGRSIAHDTGCREAMTAYGPTMRNLGIAVGREDEEESA